MATYITFNEANCFLAFDTTESIENWLRYNSFLADDEEVLKEYCKEYNNDFVSMYESFNTIVLKITEKSYNNYDMDYDYKDKCLVIKNIKKKDIEYRIYANRVVSKNKTTRFIQKTFDIIQQLYNSEKDRNKTNVAYSLPNWEGDESDYQLREYHLGQQIIDNI